MDTSAKRQRFSVSPRAFHLLAQACAVAYALIIISGAAVRLTGSGLGCPHWPTCYAHHALPVASIHPIVEFTNRLITGFISIVTIVTIVAAYRRSPKRRDLIVLSWALLGGLVAESVWGGVVVYTDLNPWTVMVHFLVAPIFLGVAMVLVHRNRRNYDSDAVLLVPRPILICSRVLIGLTVAVVAAGTAVSNAGPHAGNFAGQHVAKRLPVELRSVVELHGALAAALAGFTVALIFAISAIGAAPRIRLIGERLILAVAVQAGIGIVQYAMHLPVGLVELHVIGAVSVMIGVVRFSLEMHDHPAIPEFSLRGDHREAGSVEGLQQAPIV